MAEGALKGILLKSEEGGTQRSRGRREEFALQIVIFVITILKKLLFGSAEKIEKKFIFSSLRTLLLCVPPLPLK
ncbi:MAG: hypothetical protein WDM90_03205 [Ferruginibacter sp.]